MHEVGLMHESDATIELAAMKILAIGGGGFTTGTHPGLDDLLLSLIGDGPKHIGYVGTASDDDPIRLRFFHTLIAPRGALANVMPAHASAREAAAWVQQHNVIVVGGGDTARLLQRWRATGFDKALRDAGDDGIVLAGVSAGAACWFEKALVRGSSGQMDSVDGLGFLKGSVCAHFNSDAERRSAFTAHIQRGAIPPGVGIDDGVGVLFRDDDQGAAWSAVTGGWAYRFSRDLRGDVISSRLPALVNG